MNENERVAILVDQIVRQQEKILEQEAEIARLTEALEKRLEPIREIWTLKPMSDLIIVLNKQIEAQQAEISRLKAALEPIMEVSQKFEHLNQLLSDAEWMMDDNRPQSRILYEAWKAIDKCMAGGGIQ